MMDTAPLPRGRHGMSRDDVEASQRHRLERAVAEAVRTHGFAQATVAHIVRAASVSRQTFYELYESKDQCYAALLARYGEELAEVTEQAFADVDTADGFAAAASEVLAFFAADETMAYCLLFEPGGAGRTAPAARMITRAAIARVIGPQDPFAARGFAPMWRRLVEEEVEAGRTDRLADLAPQVAAMLRTYVGP